MAETLRPVESPLSNPEKVVTAFKVLRTLVESKVDALPLEIRSTVQSVSFQASQVGRSLNRDSSMSKITVFQVREPWLLVEFEDTVGQRHIGHLFHETGKSTRFGDFNPYSEKPAIELVDEFVDSIDFYEKLLWSDACVSEISLRV